MRGIPRQYIESQKSQMRMQPFVRYLSLSHCGPCDTTGHAGPEYMPNFAIIMTTGALIYDVAGLSTGTGVCVINSFRPHSYEEMY